MISNAVLQKILVNVTESTYYSVILDWTTNLCHQEQMTVVLPCVETAGKSVNIVDTTCYIMFHWKKFLNVEVFVIVHRLHTTVGEDHLEDLMILAVETERTQQLDLYHMLDGLMLLPVNDLSKGLVYVHQPVRRRLWAAGAHLHERCRRQGFGWSPEREGSASYRWSLLPECNIWLPLCGFQKVLQTIWRQQQWWNKAQSKGCGIAPPGMDRNVCSHWQDQQRLSTPGRCTNVLLRRLPPKSNRLVRVSRVQPVARSPSRQFHIDHYNLEHSRLCKVEMLTYPVSLKMNIY